MGFREDPTQLAKFVSSHILNINNKMAQAILIICVCLYRFAGPQRISHGTYTVVIGLFVLWKQQPIRLLSCKGYPLLFTEGKLLDFKNTLDYRCLDF